MRDPLSKKTRIFVTQRAELRCEYCRVKEEDAFLSFHVDHIISLKHGGGSELDNLAYACSHCNQNKGTDLTTFVGTYDNIVPIFNPRVHDWFFHFEASNGLIIAQTKMAEATVKLLRLNDPERVIIRQLLQEIGDFP